MFLFLIFSRIQNHEESKIMSFIIEKERKLFLILTILVIIFPHTSTTKEPLNKCETFCKALIHSSLDLEHEI